jgi:hypothetical protein
MLIVGSKAFQLRFPNQKRPVNDVDIIGYSDDLSYLKDMLKPTEIIKRSHTILLKNITQIKYLYDTKNVELLLADNSKSLQMYLEYDRENLFASEEVLFSLKSSHIHYPIKFYKHISDFTFLFNHFKGVDVLSDITSIHKKEIRERLNRLSPPSLNKTVDEFFSQSKDYVKPYFIHDEIHMIMAHYNEPLYKSMQDDKNFAKCNKTSWESFSYEDKCKCVLEEAYVISLERKILPMIFGSGSGYTNQEAFDWALMRICTTLCSGWFREFATVNYFTIKNKMNINYVEKFLENYQNGKIKKIKN